MLLFGGLSLCQSCFRGWKFLVAMEKMVVRLGGPQENLRTAKRSTEKSHFDEMTIPTDPHGSGFVTSSFRLVESV